MITREELHSRISRYDVSFETFKINFKAGYETYDRYGLVIHGEYGSAEVSPLTGYFDDIDACIKGAIHTVTKPWPEALRDEVPINSLLSAKSDLQTLDNALHTLKVKINQPSDYEKVAFIRDQVGSKTKIRLDCNAQFDVETAKMFAKLVLKYDIEFIEQPCKTIEECAQVNIATDIPIALDETANTLEDIKEAATLSAADIIVIKVQPSHGLHQALELAYAWDKDVVVSSMMESQVGLNVGMALAKALPELNYACGLDPSVIDNVVFEPVDT